MLPTDGCPPLRGLQRVTVGVADRPLQGGEIRAADVGSGSIPLHRVERELS
jgi:hypothetical protein